MKKKNNFSWPKAIAHALEWRVISIFIDFTVAYLITKNFSISFSITSINALLKTFGHAAWVKVKFRRVEGKLY